jgi:hypothetical protein
MPAAELARILIRGTKDGRIPARDFWSPVIEEVTPIMKNALAQGLALAVRGRDPQLVLRRAASECHDVLLAAIEDFTTPPNADSTIKSKGRNDPLVDEGDLRDSTFGESHA